MSERRDVANWVDANRFIGSFNAPARRDQIRVHGLRGGGVQITTSQFKLDVPPHLVLELCNQMTDLHEAFANVPVKP